MDRIKQFFSSRWFDSRHKTKLHIAQAVLVVLIIGLTGARVASKPKNIPVARSDTLPIVMGIKSIVFLLYMFLTEHVARFQRWSSLKAYAIINTLEILFWFVVIIITFMGISQFCTGTSCLLAWIVALVAFIITSLAVWVAVISWKDQRYWKKYGTARGVTYPQQTNNVGSDDNYSFSSRSAMK